jgi:hypothetical protein
LDGIISADASVVQIPEELLAGQPSPRFGPVSVIVPVHGSTPHRRSSGLFRDPKISAYDAIFMPVLNPSFGCPYDDGYGPVFPAPILHPQSPEGSSANLIKGDGHELGSDRGQLEAVQGQGQGEVGPVDRR